MVGGYIIGIVTNQSMIYIATIQLLLKCFN